MRWTAVLITGIGFAFLGACAREPAVPTYQRNQAGTAFGLDYGEVLEVRVVRVEGDRGIIGTWGGASIGRAVGQVSSNRRNTRIVGSAIGGVAGAVAGRAIERKLTAEEALEITVQLDDGEAIVVVQVDGLALEPGDRVRVTRGRNGSASVSPI